MRPARSLHEGAPELDGQASGIIPAICSQCIGRVGGRMVLSAAALAVYAARRPSEKRGSESDSECGARRWIRACSNRFQIRKPGLLVAHRQLPPANRSSNAFEYLLQCSREA